MKQMKHVVRERTQRGFSHWVLLCNHLQRLLSVHQDE